MYFGSSFSEDNLPPGSRSKRPAFDALENDPLRHKKTTEQKYIALPAPGMPPKGSSATNPSHSSPSLEGKASFLRTFPREVRNLIYKDLAALFTLDDRSLVVDGELLSTTPSFSPLSIIARSLSTPLVLVNKQFLLEFVEELFLTGTVCLVGGPCRIYEWLHGQQHEMSKLHQIEFQWEGMPLNLLERLEDITNKEIRPLLKFIRLSTQVQSITIPLYFMERSEQTAFSAARSIRRPDETRLARSNRRQIPQFWTTFIYYALKNLLAPQSSFEEIIIRYHPYDMWTCLDPEVNVRNLLGKIPSEWKGNVAPDLCNLRTRFEDDERIGGLDEIFHNISVHERGEAEEGMEALIRFRRPAD